MQWHVNPYFKKINAHLRKTAMEGEMKQLQHSTFTLGVQHMLLQMKCSSTVLALRNKSSGRQSFLTHCASIVRLRIDFIFEKTV